MDLAVRAPRIPAPGETVLGMGYKTSPGGKGANQAVAAARFGASVAFIGCIGDDAHAARLREALAAERVDTHGLLTREDKASGLALITIAENGENAIVVAAGANADLTPEHVARNGHLVREADVLLVQLEVPTTAVAEAISIAAGAGKAVILNAAPARALPPDLLRKVDVLVVNRGEASRLLGVEAVLDPARLALRLPELGPPTAILTLGAHGAILAHKGRPRRVNAPAVKAVDSVGCGDAFCGVLACAWAKVHDAAKRRHADEYPLAEEAVRLAACAGAIAATRSGALSAMPTADEVRAFLSA